MVDNIHRKCCRTCAKANAKHLCYVWLSCLAQPRRGSGSITCSSSSQEQNAEMMRIHHTWIYQQSSTFALFFYFFPPEQLKPTDLRIRSTCARAEPHWMSAAIAGDGTEFIVLAVGGRKKKNLSRELIVSRLPLLLLTIDIFNFAQTRPQLCGVWKGRDCGILKDTVVHATLGRSDIP